MKITGIRMTLTIETPYAPEVRVAPWGHKFQPAEVKVFLYESGQVASEVRGQYVGLNGKQSGTISTMPYRKERLPIQIEAEKMGRDFLAEALNAWEARDE